MSGATPSACAQFAGWCRLGHRRVPGASDANIVVLVTAACRHCLLPLAVNSSVDLALQAAGLRPRQPVQPVSFSTIGMVRAA